MDRIGNEVNTAIDKEEMLKVESFSLDGDDQYYKLLLVGSMHKRITKNAVEQAQYTQSAKKAPGPDKLSFRAICLLWKWDKERIIGLAKVTIHTVQHPAVWKWASRVKILKPGMDNYTKSTAYCTTALLSCMEMVVLKKITEQLSEEAEWRGLLSNEQFPNRKRQSAINAAAIMVNRAQAEWMTSDITAVILIDIKAAFPSIAKGRLVKEKETKHVDGDLMRWIDSVISERMVEMIIECNATMRHQLKAGVV